MDHIRNVDPHIFPFVSKKHVSEESLCFAKVVLKIRDAVKI